MMKQAFGKVTKYDENKNVEFVHDYSQVYDCLVNESLIRDIAEETINYAMITKDDILDDIIDSRCEEELSSLVKFVFDGNARLSEKYLVVASALEDIDLYRYLIATGAWAYTCDCPVNIAQELLHDEYFHEELSCIHDIFHDTLARDLDYKCLITHEEYLDLIPQMRLMDDKIWFDYRMRELVAAAVECDKFDIAKRFVNQSNIGDIYYDIFDSDKTLQFLEELAIENGWIIEVENQSERDAFVNGLVDNLDSERLFGYEDDDYGQYYYYDEEYNSDYYNLDRDPDYNDRFNQTWRHTMPWDD